MMKRSKHCNFHTNLILTTFIFRDDDAEGEDNLDINDDSNELEYDYNQAEYFAQNVISHQ